MILQLSCVKHHSNIERRSSECRDFLPLCLKWLLKILNRMSLCRLLVVSVLIINCSIQNIMPDFKKFQTIYRWLPSASQLWKCLICKRLCNKHWHHFRKAPPQSSYWGSEVKESVVTSVCVWGLLPKIFKYFLIMTTVTVFPTFIFCTFVYDTCTFHAPGNLLL